MDSISLRSCVCVYESLKERGDLERFSSFGFMQSGRWVEPFIKIWNISFKA